jgi:hypothetical protein
MMKKAVGGILTMALVLGVGLWGQSPDPKLAFLAPLVNKDWRGVLKAPDGSAEWETTCRFEAVWAGRVIKYSRATPEMGTDVWRNASFRFIKSREKWRPVDPVSVLLFGSRRFYE